MAALELPVTHFSKIVDSWLLRIGGWVSWLWLLLLLVVVGNVVMRYIFDEGSIELEEIQWHIYSVGFLLGLSYALQSDSHIRIDVVSERFHPRVRAWLELYGILLALIPFIILILVYSVPFVQHSYSVSEISQAPGGLPYRWVIKACLPLGFVLLLLAGLSRLTRVCKYLFGATNFGTAP
jgi:TRAP-type mannitol/chloroaromatic compound transport system permease small subunit